MAKVLLIQPHEDIRTKKVIKMAHLPLSLIYIGSAIEDRHQVKIYDRNLVPEDDVFLKYVKEYNPDIIGMNSITAEILFDIVHLGKLIKKEFPNIMIVVGGVHATIEPDSVLREKFIDYIIRGEGEFAFLDFCDTFDKDKSKLKTLKNVNKNPLRPFVNMDDLKLPNYSLVDIKKYGVFFVNMSRGCPGNCSFCYSSKMWGINGNPCIRSYSTKRAIEFLKELIEKYHVRSFFIVDDNFIPFKSRAIEICNFLKNYKVHFFCFGRADYINDEILIALKKAGCHTIQVGIESGNQRVLDFLNKKVTVQQNIDSIKFCKKHKLKIDASFMIGITTETPEELKDTVELIKIYKPDDVDVKIFSPMPGTTIFDYCIKNDFFKKPKTLEEWALWTGNQRSIHHNTSKISDETLTNAIRELGAIGFYKNKFKRFFYWMSVGEFKYILKSFKKIIFVRNTGETKKSEIQIPGIEFIKNIFKKG